QGRSRARRPEGLPRDRLADGLDRPAALGGWRRQGDERAGDTKTQVEEARGALMMRLPRFRYVGPRDLRGALEVLAAEGPEAQVVAGGTDLFPNMKRRQQTPRVVVGLRRIESLHASLVEATATLGANLTLTELVRDKRLRDAYPALQKAAFSISTPHLRNMG